MKERILVTSALPYANGPIHFGHIAGAYLPADIFVRFQRLCGADIIYICGTDEHGVPITISAEKEGISPKEYVDKYHKVIKGIFDNFNIKFDNFSRTTTKQHYELAQDFFMDLLRKNLIRPRVSSQYFCEKCDKFLADRYVRGICPKCGAENARGDECTSCGAWLDVMEIKEAKCGICGSKPVIKETKHWYLQLQEFSDKLDKWLDSKTNWKENVKTFMKSMIKEGLRERAITRDLKWGVPLPLENTEGKVLYVWFDAPIGYISITKEWAIKMGKPEEWKKYWLDKNTRIIHFIGKDNIPFHCIVWPSLIMGQDIDYNLPSEVPANEFYNLEGRQFSKSEGWYIDIDDFFSKYNTDSIRYAIAANAPESKDSEFTWKDFQLRNNSELANIFGNFAYRTMAFIEKYMDGVIPNTGASSEATKKVLKESAKLIDEIHSNYSKFEVRKACFNIMELGRLANKFYDTEAPWSTRKDNMEKCRLTMETCCILISRLAFVSFPIIPDSAEKLWKMLGNITKLEMISWDNIKKINPAGQKLNNPEILFKRIEDADIEIEVNKLYKRGEKKKKTSKKTAGVFEPVTIEDFKKISLKVGEILVAEPIEKSKKLLKLKVLIGKEERQIVAGIAEYYKPDALINKKVVIVANLEPAKIFGVKSEGMLLAARADNMLKLVTIEGELPNGSNIG